MIKLEILLVLLALFGIAYAVTPEHDAYEIPDLEDVPVPGLKPPTPAQLEEVERWIEKAEEYFNKIEDEKRLAALAAQDGTNMCPKFVQVPVRSGPLILGFKWIAHGTTPCKLLEGGSPSWYLNGKDL